jgi:hypothetical protein
MPIVILLPTIGWAWPALGPIVTAVASGLGYAKLGAPKGRLRGRVSQEMDAIRIETVPLDRVMADVVSEEIGREERVMFKKDDLTLVFRKDARGKFFVEVAGPAATAGLDLRRRGEEFARELVKKFAYHRLAEQLTRAGATIVEEKVEDSGRVTLSARKWR